MRDFYIYMYLLGFKKRQSESPSEILTTHLRSTDNGAKGTNKYYYKHMVVSHGTGFAPFQVHIVQRGTQ